MPGYQVNNGYCDNYCHNVHNKQNLPSRTYNQYTYQQKKVVNTHFIVETRGKL